MACVREFVSEEDSLAWQGRVRAFTAGREQGESRVLFASRPAGNSEDEADDNSSE